MPIIVKCKDCGHVIYCSDGAVNLEILSDILKALDTCSSCGHKFKGEITVEDIRIKPLTSIKIEAERKLMDVSRGFS